MMNDAGDCEVVRKPAQPKPALQCTQWKSYWPVWVCSCLLYSNGLRKTLSTPSLAHAAFICSPNLSLPHDPMYAVAPGVYSIH